MPLPMPRSVMSSPIHISSTVPAVSVTITSSTRGSGKPGSRMTFGAPRPKNTVLAPPRPKTNVSPVAWSRAMAIVR